LRAGGKAGLSTNWTIDLLIAKLAHLVLAEILQTIASKQELALSAVRLSHWGAAETQTRCPESAAPSRKQPRPRRRRSCRRRLFADNLGYAIARAGATALWSKQS
jgi:hypothetical protein